MAIPPDVQETLRKGKKQILAIYGDDPNLTGAGVAFRRRNNEWTDEPVVVIMVAKKRPENLVSRRRLLPKTVTVGSSEWGVDVVQGGPFSVHSLREDGPESSKVRITTKLSDDPEIKEKIRPLRQGSGIGNMNAGVMVGTLGCFVIDNTDETICLLSNNHVIARYNSAHPGEAIIQPGSYDGGGAADKIATLKRFAPLTDGTEVDAAIAQLDDQSNYTNLVARDLMAPISRKHPAVGMVIAGDLFGNAFLTRMDSTVAALNIRPLGTRASSGGVTEGIATPEIFMPIEKVGRRTGYTSASIVGLHMDVDVDTHTDIGNIKYENCVWTMFFNWEGDSGSVACAGGNGNLPLFIFIYLLPCLMLASLESYYDVPLTNDEALSDKLRDEFMAQSLVGRLLISTTYVNTETMKQRLAMREAMESKDNKGHPQDKAFAQSYYKQYHDVLANLLTNPDADATVTEDHLWAVADANYGLLSNKTITYEEYGAAQNIIGLVLKPTVGMNRAQVIDYFNKTTTYQTVYDLISKVTTIEVIGPVTTDGK